MRGRAVRRSSVVVWIVLVVGGLLATPALASGGGGCGRRVTDAPGTQVRIRNFCFGPTILRVQPGETVTWANLDTFPHSVLGANGSWGGFEELSYSGATTSFRFTRSGVYPYVCTYHPGMIGAVVVGDGAGRGIADAVTTAAGPVIPEQPDVAAEPDAAPEADVGTEPVVDVRDASSAGAWPAGVVWGAGLLVLIGAALAIGRRRRTRASTA